MGLNFNVTLDFLGDLDCNFSLSRVRSIVLIYLIKDLEEDNVRLMIQSLTHTNIYYNKLKRFIGIERYIENIVSNYIDIDDSIVRGLRCVVTNADRAVKYNATGLFVYRKPSHYSKNKQDISKDSVWSVLDSLEQAGLIDIYIGYMKLDSNDEHLESVRSFIIFKQEFIHLFNKNGFENVKYGDGDIVDIIDRAKTKELKQRIKKETRRVNGVANIKKDLMQFNKRLAQTVFHLNGTPLPPPIYKRVFTDSLDFGGRYYSIDGRYQCVSQNIRKHLFIDNEQVVELDYGSLHPAICYAVSGEEMEEGFKPYECDTSFLNINEKAIENHKIKFGIEKYEPVRSICKQALLCSINAKNIEAAFMAVAHELATDLKRPEIKKKYVGIERPFPAKQLCQALCDHNYKIAHFFFSDSGVVLQNLDSKMADLIIQDFIADDEVLLPYHDSFIVKKSLEEKLETSMNKAYTYVVGSSINCRIDKKY